MRSRWKALSSETVTECDSDRIAEQITDAVLAGAFPERMICFQSDVASEDFPLNVTQEDHTAGQDTARRVQEGLQTIRQVLETRDPRVLHHPSKDQWLVEIQGFKT